MAHRKALIIIAHEGYQSLEYALPKKTLEHAGIAVITASNKPGMATAHDKTQTKVDVTTQDAIARDYAAIIVAGGPGAMENLDNQVTYQLLTEAVDLGKLVAAICVGPRILAHANLLTDVAATGWDGDNELADIFEEYGVTYVQAPVVTDQNFITASGPAAAQEFADAIVAAIKNNRS